MQSQRYPQDKKEQPTPEELQQKLFREKAKQKAKEDREAHEAQVLCSFS